MSKAITETETSGHGSVKTYITGFVLSVALTLAAYFMVVHRAFGRQGIIAGILLLAVVQFVVQMTFFLHLFSEKRPRWNLTLLMFMLIVLVILVFGSLWIMNNLNYHMNPNQVNTYLKNQDDL